VQREELAGASQKDLLDRGGHAPISKVAPSFAAIEVTLDVSPREFNSLKVVGVSARPLREDKTARMRRGPRSERATPTLSAY
jgi:hypothetical protein